MQVSLISSVMEFHSQDIIIKSSLSQVSNPVVPFFGPVPKRCPNFPLPFRKVRTSCDHFK